MTDARDICAIRASQCRAVVSSSSYGAPPGAAPVHTAATAYFGLYRETQLRPGETLFVAGGAGGVGSCVIQLAAAMGARVIASASVRDHDWCRSLGADVVLDYREDKMHQKLAAAAPEGIDIWWDTSGHHDFQTTLPLLNKRAKVVVMAGMSATPVLPVGHFILKTSGCTALP